MLLPLSNVQQRQQADCLAACAQMVLAYLQVPVNYDRLLRTLETSERGTPFSRLEQLRSWDLSVILGEKGDLGLFQPYIAIGLPVIVPIQTEWFGYWQNTATEHAIVVVGIDVPQEMIYVNDPVFTEEHQVLTFNEFDAGWTEMDRGYAIISLTQVL